MTTATQAPPPVQLTRNAQNIDAAVALLSGPDASLEDVAMLLRRLATADVDAISTQDPAARLQGLCAFIAQRLRDSTSAELRSAPLETLSEFIGDSTRACVAPSCPERVLPWDDSACSPECAREAHLNGCD